jgi:predicted nucleic acid-binding protein
VRVCLDTNVLIAAVATRGLCADVLRDPTDRWVLATAVASQAEILVTGDDDSLLAVQGRAPIRVLSPRAF